jgi:enoyl reductase
MIRRAIVGAIAAATLVPLAASTPATASTGTGCNGSSCSVSLDQWIKYSGNGYSHGGSVNHVPVDEQPPPCLWIPIGDQITGSQYIVNNFGDVTPASSLFDIYNSVQQAKQLLKNGGPAGTWYNLPINPAAGAAGRDACLKLPAFFFVLPGQAPPLPQVPPEILAEFAYNHMRLPNPTVRTSPATKGFVNLATFVWWHMPRTTWVTAALPDGQAATVVAQVQSASISTNPAGAGTVSTTCGPGGSRFPPGHPPTTGAGVPPDCGVLWSRPAAGATVTVTVTWQVLFHAGTGHEFAGNPVPGTVNPITTAGTSNLITVQEIQSVNGG